jgi:predicted DNA-binding protein YlxM (UPF0122 family)
MVDDLRVIIIFKNGWNRNPRAVIKHFGKKDLSLQEIHKDMSIRQICVLELSQRQNGMVGVMQSIMLN